MNEACLLWILCFLFGRPDFRGLLDEQSFRRLARRYGGRHSIRRLELSTELIYGALAAEAGVPKYNGAADEPVRGPQSPIEEASGSLSCIPRRLHEIALRKDLEDRSDGSAPTAASGHVISVFMAKPSSYSLVSGSALARSPSR